VIRSALPARSDARRLLLGTYMSALGTGMTLPFLYVYLHEVRRIDATLVGLVVAWMGALSLVLAGPWGSLMDRVGPRRVLLPLMVLGACGAGSWALVHHPWQAFVSGSLMAAAGSAVFSGSNTLLATLTSEEERQRVFGLSFALLNLGIGTGGVVSGFIADVHHPASFRVLYTVDGVSWLLPAFILASMPSVGRALPRDHDAEPSGGYRTVFADRSFRRLFVFSLLLMSCGYAQIEVGLPAFATSVAHVSTRVVAWALAANTAVIVCGQLVMTARLQGRSRSRALAVAATVIALSWLILAVGGFGRHAGAALPIAATVGCASVFAFAETMFSPTLPALTNSLASDELRARYNAAGSLVWGITSVVGPLTAAPLIGHGLAGVWVALIVAGSLGAAALALSLRRVLSPAQDGRSEHRALQTSPV
jgi:MFS family permease